MTPKAGGAAAPMTPFAAFGGGGRGGIVRRAPVAYTSAPRPLSCMPWKRGLDFDSCRSSGLPKCPAEPGIPADRRLMTNLEVQAAENTHGDGRAVEYGSSEHLFQRYRLDLRQFIATPRSQQHFR